MKRLKKSIIAAVAITLIGLVSSVGAMNLKTDGMGDALLFPVFNGFVDNYFTVSNNSTDWIQAHVRFRGAEWSAELRDFDIVLSPGDVFVFRLADLDGDGAWELDQSIDEENWTYTGMLKTDRMEPSSNLLEPTAGVVTDAQLTHQRRAGYVEVIGEAVLVGLTKTVALAGMDAYVWSDYANGLGAIGHPGDRGLTDVGNVLSGTAFISMPGNANIGLAYNAEAIQDFRTDGAAHRIDNYFADTGVIVHDNNALANDGAYLYRFPDATSAFEQRISFNNTWGPTLADGDDDDQFVADAFDVRYSEINSITEVENAILADGQSFNAYYFSNSETTSSYFVHFPTKFYYGESAVYFGAPDFQSYIDSTVTAMMNLGVTLGVEIWDIFEHSGGTTVASGNTSPALPTVERPLGLGQELNLFDIGFVKSAFNTGNVGSYESGRVVLNIGGALFPGLAYTFETSATNVGNWRSMQR
jgi:hypothetical protein